MNLRHDQKLAFVDCLVAGAWIAIAVVCLAVAGGCEKQKRAAAPAQLPDLPKVAQQVTVVATAVTARSVAAPQNSNSVTGLTVSTADTVMAAASPQPSLNSTKMSWRRSADSWVTGYAIYYRQTNAISWYRANVGNVTNATISDLQVGVFYEFYCVSYDGLGVESRESNKIVVMIPAITTIRVGEYVVESTGASFRSNLMQLSTDLKIWSNLMTWVGDGTTRSYRHTNGTMGFFRTVPAP